MPRLHKTPICEADLFAVWEHIAADNRAAANRVLERLESRFQLLLKFPDIGERQDKYHPGMRSVVEGQYIVFYEPTDYGVTVHRVIHGARQWEDLLS